jgi:hypothetical protein
MIKQSKLILIAAIAAVSLASPVLAQSRHTRDDGQRAFAMVPATGSGLHDPAITGGGSRGYNENVLKDQW